MGCKVNMVQLSWDGNEEKVLIIGVLSKFSHYKYFKYKDTNGTCT